MKFVRPLIHVIAIALAAWTFRQPAGEFAAMVGPAMDRTLWFGLFATVFLYLALLPGPLYAAFPKLPGRALFTHARRAFGIDSAVFAGIHGWYGFFGWVGGFEGLEFWSWDYNASLLLGTIAFAILALLAVTSFDVVVNVMGRLWKRVHGAVYVAALLVIMHAASVTIHILNLRPPLYGWFVAIAALLVLEFLRLRARGKNGTTRVAGGVLAVSLALLFWSTFLISHHRH